MKSVNYLKPGRYIAIDGDDCVEEFEWYGDDDNAARERAKLMDLALTEKLICDTSDIDEWWHARRKGGCMRGFLTFLLLLVFALTVSGMLTVIPLISTETNHFCGIELIIHDGDAWAISGTLSPYPSWGAVFGKTLMQWSKAEGFVFDQIELTPNAEG